MIKTTWDDVVNNWYDWLNDAHKYQLQFGHFASYLEAISEEQIDGSDYWLTLGNVNKTELFFLSTY